MVDDPFKKMLFQNIVGCVCLLLSVSLVALPESVEHVLES